MQETAADDTRNGSRERSEGTAYPNGVTGENGPRIRTIELDEQLFSRMTVFPELDAIAYVSYAEPVSPMQEVPSLGTGGMGMVAGSEPVVVSQPQTSIAPTVEPVTPQTAAVFVFVNEDGTVSLMSEDTAALDRLTVALAQVNTPAPESPKFNRVLFEDREFTEFAIRNLAPSVLMDRLQMRMSAHFRNRQPAMSPAMQQQGFGGRGGMGRGMGGGGMGGGMGGYDPTGYATTTMRPAMPQLIPQDMTNTLIVIGTRSDRRIIAELIEQIDIPDPVYPIERVIVKNADVSKVFNELMAVYGRQILATRLPNGQSPAVSYDLSTNCIWIKGPEDFAKEIAQYIRETDEKIKENPIKKIQVVKLNNINANVANAMLQMLYPNQQQMYNPYGVMMQMYPQGGSLGYPSYNMFPNTMPSYNNPYGRSMY